MRKYSLADGSKRSVVDLRNYEDIIRAAVEEFAPGTIVNVCKDYYTVNEALTLQSAVTNGHWCGGKRPQCGASAASLS